MEQPRAGVNLLARDASPWRMLLRELRWRTHTSDANADIMNLNLWKSNWEKSLGKKASGAGETRPGSWEARASTHNVPQYECGINSTVPQLFISPHPYPARLKCRDSRALKTARLNL